MPAAKLTVTLLGDPIRISMAVDDDNVLELLREKQSELTVSVDYNDDDD
jgi:hypothetical protein